MMRYKKLKETAGVLALAATLFSCGTFRTETGSNPSPSLVRHAEIPQMQIDAAAVYARMVSYVTPEICIAASRTVTQKLISPIPPVALPSIPATATIGRSWRSYMSNWTGCCRAEIR